MLFVSGKLFSGQDQARADFMLHSGYSGFGLLSNAYVSETPFVRELEIENEGSLLDSAGTRCDRSVDLMSIYPTLCNLTGIEKPGYVSGHDITTLLRDPNSPWTFPAITTHGRRNHSVKTETHRYIRYANGDEELYDVVADPYEWKNLAELAESASVKKKLARWLPPKEMPEPNMKKANK